MSVLLTSTRDSRRAVRPIALIGALIGLALLWPPFTAEAQSALTSNTYEANVERYINQKRDAHDLRPVRFESCTDARAERWAQHVATTGDFQHQSTAKMMDVCNVTFAAETLGAGAYGPRALVRAWMSSPLHRAVLLSRQAKGIGVGTYQDVSGQWVTAVTLTRS